MIKRLVEAIKRIDCTFSVSVEVDSKKETKKKPLGAKLPVKQNIVVIDPFQKKPVKTMSDPAPTPNGIFRVKSLGKEDWTELQNRLKLLQ